MLICIKLLCGTLWRYFVVTLSLCSISQESVYVSRLYNRLVTALLKYEVLWLSQWRGGVETGRAGLQSTLLAQHEDGERGVVVRVNCSQRWAHKHSFVCVKNLYLLIHAMFCNALNMQTLRVLMHGFAKIISLIYLQNNVYYRYLYEIMWYAFTVRFILLLYCTDFSN